MMVAASAIDTIVPVGPAPAIAPYRRNLELPVLVFDIDGVQADFCLGFTFEAHLLGKVEAPWSTKDQDTWHFDFHVDPVWAAVEKSPSFWYDLKPLASGHDVRAMQWAAERCEILYVTARRGLAAERQTWPWLRDQGFPPGQLHFAGGKIGKGPSLEPYRERIVGVLEDSPANIAALRADGFPVTVRRWKYNHSLPGPEVTSIAQFISNVLL
jgi:hypothetical protein